MVATPLPPLKRSQTGKLWPITAANPATRPASQGARARTATAPLPPSSTTVAAARALLPVRSTLVAPMLPEPSRRISPSPAVRVSTRPKGMEPSRYPAAAARRYHQVSAVPASGMAQPSRP